MDQVVAATARITVLTLPASSFAQRLAASELRRGLLQLGYAGPLLVGERPGPEGEPGELRFVLEIDRAMAAESYTIAAVQDQGCTTVTLGGGSDAALLYAVFDFLERQGACFGIDGDVYPLELPASWQLPAPAEPWHGAPRFRVRGLLPWPDFLNCISVYNEGDWRAYLEAMLRMRFNTLGIHVYGQEDKWAESFLSFEYGGVGHTAFTDTTATDRWGYLPQRTSRFGMSAAQYFDGEVFGADATRCARSPWEAAEMAQSLWRTAFAYAAQLGIRTGVGFEPYRVPEEIYRACPPEVRSQEVYEYHGQTQRIQRIDPTSRTARYILETRLAQLLDAYPSVSYVYLWEDEFMNWASQVQNVELPVALFQQAHDFLRRHAPDKRLVLAGWGGVVRHFAAFHRALPEDVIFTALSDQVGWEPVAEAFGQLGDRERWPIPWLEDDPAMWFPQFHTHRFAADLARAEQFGCQGVLGIHWRHRIVDPTAGHMARRFWTDELAPARYYAGYARTQAAAARADALAALLDDVDANRRLLATWTGDYQPDGRRINRGFSGDYDEAFTVESGFEIPDAVIAAQQEVIAALEALLAQAATPLERERLGYLYGQIRFLDPYARAWRTGVALHRLLREQQERRRKGEAEAAVAAVRAQGLPLWLELLQHVREAVLSFQHTVATRNDLGMLASIHNKFVRIATFRMQASLLEFLDELPPEAQTAHAAALAPDTELDAAVIVPTRPTRLAPGESLTLTALAPGLLEVAAVTLHWRRLEAGAWQRQPMHWVARRTYAATLQMPSDADGGIEYYVAAEFAAAPAPRLVTAPPAGAAVRYLITT
jgi:hypothetical protein